MNIETGTVSSWHHQGYAFVRPDTGGADVFMHVSKLHRLGITKLRSGDRLRFTIDASSYGRHASNIRMLQGTPA